MNQRRVCNIFVVVAALVTPGTSVNASVYRIVPASSNVIAGETYPLRVEVETQPQDNVVGAGFFSFAVDLTLSGSAGASGSDISNIMLNTTEFDDVLGSALGHTIDDGWVGAAGVTSSFVPPTFGDHPNDITWLLDFDLTIPESALPGQTITITPSEGAFRNLIVNDAFDPVAPQIYEPANLTIVPEPLTAILLSVGTALGLWRRRGLP